MLAENFPDLTQLYGQGPLSGYMGGVQTDNARRSQQINQQSALQDMYKQEQMLPVDIAMKQAQTENYGASTKHIGENTRGAKFKNDMDEMFKSEQYQAEKAKFRASMSKADLEDANNQIKQLMLHDNPKVRDTASQLRMMMDDVFPDYAKENQRHPNRMAEIAATGANQQATAGIRAQGGASPRPMTLSQYEAMVRQKASQGDETAMQALAQLEEDKRLKAAAGALIGDTRTREILGNENTKPDNSSTGKVAEKAKPGQYEKGKQYKGRTGTYEYVGGDPADKASWKKVD